MILLRAFILIALISGPAWSATYYVDTAAANDNGAGTSEGAAWKTINKVNNSSFSAGDYILFKRGGTWGEALTVPSSGSTDLPITFGAYGTGARPIIDAEDTRDFCIFTNGKGYLTFSGLHLKRSVTYSNLFIWFNAGFSNIIVDDCISELSSQSGVQVSNSHASQKTTDVIIRNSTFRTNAKSGIDVSPGVNTVTIAGNTVHGNTTGTTDYHAGIHVFGNQVDGAGIVVENNEVYDQQFSGNLWSKGNGIHIDEVSGTPGPIVRRNRVYSNEQIGIFIEHVKSGAQVYNNLSYLNAPAATLGGIGVFVYRGCDGAIVYNNTSVGNNVGIGSIGETSGDAFQNNIFKNNISVSNVRQLWAQTGGSNDGGYGSGNVYEKNAFGVQSANFLRWVANTDVSTYDAFIAASSQTDNNVESDPLLTTAYVPLGGGKTGAVPIYTMAEWVAQGGDLYGRYPTGGTLSMGAVQYQKMQDGIPGKIWDSGTRMSKSTDAGSYVAAAVAYYYKTSDGVYYLTSSGQKYILP